MVGGHKFVGGGVYWEEISLGGRNEQIDSTPSQPQFLRGGFLGKRGDFVQGVLQFLHKK